MNRTLDLLSDSSERVPYNSPDMPVYADMGQLSNFLNYASSGHWHDDVEFSIVLSGRMSYNINGAVHTLEQGEGVFVNSRQFHNNFSPDGSDCRYICILFHPVLLCANSFLENSYVIPVMANTLFPYAVLRPSDLWQAELMGDIRRIYQLSAEGKAADLLAQSIFFHMWSILYEHMPAGGQARVPLNSRLSALRDMVGYLQKNYCEKISLADISAAGKVCQSNCSSIFNEYLHQTPMQYLTGYRLNKSAQLLQGTFMNITEIALASEFFGVSYYTETFRKYFGCTPTGYRKRRTEA